MGENNKTIDVSNQTLIKEGNIVHILGAVGGTLGALVETGIPTILLLDNCNDKESACEGLGFMKKYLKDCIELLDAIKYEDYGGKMSKIKELNFSVEDVEKVETIDIDEFNKKVEELTELGKYFESVGVISLSLWLGVATQVIMWADNKDALKDYLDINEKQTIESVGGGAKHEVTKGNLKMYYYQK